LCETVSMILNIYKEKDWTSFDVVAKLRGVLGIKKIGHAGTLDPLAEGVLIVLTEKDTKRQSEFMSMEKEYIAEIAFGAQSPSYDLETPLEFSNNKIELDELETKLCELLPKYTGEIQQRVPAYSAVKVDGQPLYKKARKGDVSLQQLPVKTVTINALKVTEVKEMEFEGTLLPVVVLKITCSKGFYVRSLANDLGEDLNVGGVLVKLTRTRIGDYTVESAKRVDEIKRL